MKIVCLALLLANLLFFAWSRWIEQPPSSSVPPTQRTVPQLALINERRPAGASVTQTEAAAPRCSSLGPFQDVSAANQAATALRTKGYEPHTRVVEGDLRAGLWVHLENLPRAEAQRLMAALKQQGISDAYLMPLEDGPAEISLGVFSEPGRAQRRAEDARAIGLKPTITDRRKGASYWLDVVHKPGDKPLDPAVLQDGDDRVGNIARVSVQECPRPASIG